MSEPEKLSCRSCSYLYLAEQGRVHGRTFQCTTCSSAERVLRQNLGEKHNLNTFSANETCKFYQEIHQKKKESQNGRLSWVTLRGILVTSLTDQRMEKFKTSVKGKELPLEVWLAQGWKEETVKAQPNWFSSELQCQVYAVPIKVTTRSEEHTHGFMRKCFSMSKKRGRTRKPRIPKDRTVPTLKWTCLLREAKMVQLLKMPRSKKRTGNPSCPKTQF